jgi:hypothetical protein
MPKLQRERLALALQSPQSNAQIASLNLVAQSETQAETLEAFKDKHRNNIWPAPPQPIIRAFPLLHDVVVQMVAYWPDGLLLFGLKS